MTKWTLITGASEGLGVEFAKIAAREGRNMILTARSKDKLEALASSLKDQGQAGEVIVIPADLNDLAQAEQLWAEASHGRDIDFLVNNAGLGRNGPFAEDEPTGEDWARELCSINVNMIALTFLMKRAIAHMQTRGGGRILNVASIAGFFAGPNMAVYHATKAYVLFLSEAVGFELRKSSVTVSALCPGPTGTKFFDDADMNSVRLLKLGPLARADKVAQSGWDGALRGKRVIVPGAMNKVIAFLPRLSPRATMSWFNSVFMAKT